LVVLLFGQNGPQTKNGAIAEHLDCSRTLPGGSGGLNTCPSRQLQFNHGSLLFRELCQSEKQLSAVSL
jgi:hypothetical protein